MAASICTTVISKSRPLAPTAAVVVPTYRLTSSAFTSSSSTNLMFSNQRSIKAAPAMKMRERIVCTAPDEEKLTRRNPLDFPVEWERPKPGRRPDIFPQFSPMKTPLPPPSPYDPPPEDEEEEDEENKEEEEDPDKEQPESRWFPFH